MGACTEWQDKAKTETRLTETRYEPRLPDLVLLQTKYDISRIIITNKFNNMSNNKELLEATVKGLQEKIQQLNTDYKEKLQELEDVNKPVIQASQMDVIDNGLQQTFENFDLDIDQFDYEVELDYENKVVLSNLTFTDTYDLHEAIMRNIEKQFKVINDETND